ncbi:DUF4259 domain-containing protein [Modestobacter sp. VKM Ac-2986]|uniref:DUF4259 domain-containing protein n=1 Tax=Modestobacter sp. VKM Ac-2986 TaxID=3004140 RepID=UPI0022AB7D6B|nr:DUF4259 domain-containing protein [Modestobacter sp. VKM Ac-2986]MCZ2829949.1 DUF4259 domain-containing protein [Modestobacter sp. VKM Ac-2986]
MGSWGTDVFESDDAADFVGDLGESADPAASLHEALSAALDRDGELESPEMSAGLAAAVLVACVAGGVRPADPTAQEVLDAGRVPVTGPLRNLARAVLDRGLTDDDNEWAELWSEAGELDDVRAGLRTSRALLG